MKDLEAFKKKTKFNKDDFKDAVDSIDKMNEDMRRKMNDALFGDDEDEEYFDATWRFLPKELPEHKKEEK